MNLKKDLQNETSKSESKSESIDSKSDSKFKSLFHFTPSQSESKSNKNGLESKSGLEYYKSGFSAHHQQLTSSVLPTKRSHQYLSK